MNSIKSFLILAVAALCFVACDRPTNEPVNPIEPVVLKIDDSAVQVKADGGEYYFTYSIESKEGGDVENFDTSLLEATVSNNDEWIHSFDCSAEGEVLFVVEPNITGSTRISKIVLSYGDAKDDIVVTQSGDGAQIEVSIDFSFEIDGPYVSMTTTPTPENIRYFAWYFSVENMESALSKSPGVTVEMYLERLIEVDISNAIYYGAYAGYTAEEAVAEITLKGTQTQYFELNGNTEFYAYGCAVSDKGEIKSDLVYTTFKTGPVAPSDNVLTIHDVEVNTDRAWFSISTTNMDQYAAFVLPASMVEGATDEELLDYYNNLDSNILVSYLHFGDYDGYVLLDEADADYYILAFGYEYGMLTTEVKRQKIHTLPYDPNVKAEFELTIDKITHYRVKASLNVEPVTALYYIDVCEADATAEDVTKEVMEAAQWYVDNGYYSNLADCFQVVGSKGSRPFEATGLYPETDYRIYIFGINEETGEINTEVTFSEVFTTPAPKVSESYITIDTDKYYNGFDIMDLYPNDFGDAEGWAVLPLEVEIHGEIVDYYYDVYVGDVTDITYPTDDEIILDLVQYGKHNEPMSYSYCYFYEPLTLIYFGKDADDNNTVVTRVPMYLDPEGCADASEFPFNPAEATAFKAERKFVK